MSNNDIHVYNCGYTDIELSLFPTLESIVEAFHNEQDESEVSDAINTADDLGFYSCVSDDGEVFIWCDVKRAKSEELANILGYQLGCFEGVIEDDMDRANSYGKVALIVFDVIRLVWQDYMELNKTT